MRPVGILPALLLSMLAGHADPSNAADPGVAAAQAPVPEADGWIITLKGNVSLSTTWDGAKTYGAEGYPSFSFRRANQPAIWGAPDDGFGISVYDSPFFSIGRTFMTKKTRLVDGQRSMRRLESACSSLARG